MNKNQLNGYTSVILAYLIWGILPVYWKLLKSVPSLEILSHRIVWSVVFLFIIIVCTGNIRDIRHVFQSSKNVLLLFICSVLVGINWLIYIWAVGHDFIIETSLGYFICPLISIVLGIFFFGEKLRKPQIAAIFTAAAGVLYLAAGYGQFPWIAILLAVTFGFYGALKKKIAVQAVAGLFIETLFLLVPSLLYIVWLRFTGNDVFMRGSAELDMFLMGAGITTSLPLLLFAAGAKAVQLSTLGFIQYLSPIFQLAVGIFIYHEDFSSAKLTAFSFVWAALILYTADSVFFSVKPRLSGQNSLQPKASFNKP